MEVVVLSGKGGTGKTTIATALSELAKDVVRIDCDVDAPNLYLFYKGENIEHEEYYGAQVAEIDEQTCIKCGKCQEYCNFNAIKDCKINPLKCEGCGTCTLVCPTQAIKLKKEKNADTYITKTQNGIISRAQMKVGSDGSGRLVSYLKKNLEEFNKDQKLTIVDGSPGIGCPVIASLTGSDASIIVVEPTQSGFEDFKRISELCKYFGVLIMICINKYDINEEISNKIEDFCKEQNYKIVGKIPYDDVVVESVNQLKPIVYFDNSIANKAIRNMWDNIEKIIYS